MRNTTLIKILFALLIVMTLAPELKAQEIVLEGPLVGQPAVRKMVLLREGRLSLSPFVGVTLLDTYRRNVLLGAKLEYNIYDWLGIGIWGAFAINGGTCGSTICTWLDTKLTKEIKSKARSNVMNLPDADRVREQIGGINGMLTFQLTFTPLRGKLGLFKALFINADFYLFLGGGIGFVKDRGGASDELALGVVDPTCDDVNPRDGMADSYNDCVKMESRIVAILPTVGAGLDLFANEWLAVNIEYRGLPMKLNISGTDEYGMTASGREADPGYYNKKAGFPDHKINKKDRVFTWVHTVNLGISFYFTFGKSKGIFKSRQTD